jgi:hypothetical protein
MLITCHDVVTPPSAVWDTVLKRNRQEDGGRYQAFRPHQTTNRRPGTYHTQWFGPGPVVVSKNTTSVVGPDRPWDTSF